MCGSMVDIQSPTAEIKRGTLVVGVSYIRQGGHHVGIGRHSSLRFLMAALCNKPGHYIFALWFLLSPFFFFPGLISVVGDWMSTTLLHMVWP